MQFKRSARYMRQVSAAGLLNAKVGCCVAAVCEVETEALNVSVPCIDESWHHAEHRTSGRAVTSVFSCSKLVMIPSVCKHWRPPNHRMKPSVRFGIMKADQVTLFDIAGAQKNPKDKAYSRVLPRQPRSAGLVQSSKQANAQTLHLFFCSCTSRLDDSPKVERRAFSLTGKAQQLGIT